MALTTLALVKPRLGIETADTTYDAILTSLINAVSESFELYCGRNFDRDTYAAVQFGSDYLRQPWNPDLWDGFDDAWSTVNYPTIAKKGEDIVLDNMPINAVLYAAYGIQPVINIVYGGSAAASIDVVSSEKIVLIENLTQTEIVLTDAMDVQDVIDRITAEANWTATAADADYTAFPAKSLLTRYIGPEDPDGATGDLYLCAAVYPFRLIKQTEGLYRSNIQIGSNTTMLILYDGGYDTADLPASLVELATKAVTDAFNGLKREADLKGETIGDYKWERFKENPFSYFGAYITQLDLFRRIPMGVA
jgi:hypothetical protein